MKDCVTIGFRRNALQQVADKRPKIALFTGVAMLDEVTDRYNAEGEARGDGYQAGGQVLTGGEITEVDGALVLSFNTPTWKNATITARGAMIYLADDSDRVVRVIDFRKDVSSTNGPFTVHLPDARDGGIISI